MIPFLSGALIPFGLVLIGALIGTHHEDHRGTVMYLLLLLVAPVLFGWCAAYRVRLRSPRPLLFVPSPRPILSCAAGFVAGLLALGATALMVFLRFSSPEWDLVIVCICTYVAVSATARLLPRCRAGTCSQCGYDISASLMFNRCPECGRPLMAPPRRAGGWFQRATSTRAEAGGSMNPS